MKKLLVLATCIIGILVTSGCTGAQGAVPTDVQVQVGIDELSSAKNIVKQVEVAAAGTVTVTLGSNRTTGFSWSETALIADTAILQQTDHKYIAPTAAAPLPGASGSEVWTFKALKKGTTDVSMDYRQPWASGQKALWTFQMTVTVK